MYIETGKYTKYDIFPWNLLEKNVKDGVIIREFQEIYIKNKIE
jgi:hypothetical protein